MNELLWIAFLLLDLCVVLAMYRFFGKAGLYVVIAYSVILCNVQVLKLVDLFGLTATLGNVLYASIFLSTDILSEMHGKKEAQRGVLLGFIVMIIMVVYMQLALVFTPHEFDSAQEPLRAIFGIQWAVTIASMSAYLISQLNDVWLFHKLKKMTGGKELWIRNNVSTLTSQLFDSTVFTVLAVLFGIFPQEEALAIFATTYLLKIIVALVDTPFLYLAKRLKPREAVDSAPASALDG